MTGKLLSDEKRLRYTGTEYIKSREEMERLFPRTVQVTINVGVAYGSDTRKVESILRRIVQQHEMVLLNPEPMITFEGFGASSLDFVIRAIIRDVGQMLIVTEGTGWVQEEGKEKHVMQPGDVVWCPPGVKHWHGATDTTHMTHLAITGRTGGSNVEWGEAVSDGQYLAGLDEQ